MTTLNVKQRRSEKIGQSLLGTIKGKVLEKAVRIKGWSLISVVFRCWFHCKNLKNFFIQIPVVIFQHARYWLEAMMLCNCLKPVALG